MRRSLLVVVGSGGVGKTTLAAAIGLASARRGHDTLVMTFDPSLRLKDSLGVGDEARAQEVEVAAGTRGRLCASLLDARQTFDRLVQRYAPDPAARDRVRPAGPALRPRSRCTGPHPRQPVLRPLVRQPGRRPRVHGG